MKCKLISLNGLTKTEKQEVKDICQSIRKNYSLDLFGLKGWRYLDRGSFKSAYYKKNFVLKLGEGCLQEGKIYERRKKQRKYLARIYAYGDGWYLQEKVSRKNISYEHSDKLFAKLKNFEDVCDYNIGRNKKGNIVLFDLFCPS